MPCHSPWPKFSFTRYFPLRIAAHFCKIESYKTNFTPNIGWILNNLKCKPILVGGVVDHIHILSTLARTCEPAEMVKEDKRSSSIWIKTHDPNLKQFAWQGGYGMFSIGFSQIHAVRRYIENQEEHHRKTSFQDEFRLLLKKYHIDFDERYVWD
ncbi:MAG: transposase [Pirellulaceae bacterium]